MPLDLVEDLEAIRGRDLRLLDERLMNGVPDSREKVGTLAFAQSDGDERHYANSSRSERDQPGTTSPASRESSMVSSREPVGA